MILGVYCSKPSEDGGVKQDTTALECLELVFGIRPRAPASAFQTDPPQNSKRSSFILNKYNYAAFQKG